MYTRPIPAQYYALATIAVLTGCSAVRGPGLGDLGVDPVTSADQADAGSVNFLPGQHATAGANGKTSTGEPVKRLVDMKCDVAPPAPPSALLPIGAGPFSMGCNAEMDKTCRADESPTHVTSLAAFQIDQTEVTQAQYYECVQSGACLAPTCDWTPCTERANHPVVCVELDDAETYCTWKHQRLPSEAEWEKAARGSDALTFPWGNDGLDCTRANFAGCGDGTKPVGSHPLGASVYGALDMAGNVVEWIKDYYDATYYGASPAENPPGPNKGEAFVGRGGGWKSPPEWQRAGARDEYEANYFKSSLGFRCVK